MKTISGIEFASEHNGTDVFRLIELAYEQGQKDVIEQLPSAQPKMGRWIHDGSKWTNRWICSECGYKWFFDCIEGAYCPNCGSDMMGEKDG